MDGEVEGRLEREQDMEWHIFVCRIYSTLMYGENVTEIAKLRVLRLATTATADLSIGCTWMWCLLLEAKMLDAETLGRSDRRRSVSSEVAL